MIAESGGAPRIVVRRARNRDGESVASFLDGLTSASRYQRFFSGIRRVSPDQLLGMVGAAPGRLVLLALDGDAVVGHVMAVRVGEGLVDVGIVVAEAYRHQGIGSLLVRVLADALAGSGLTEVCCDVLGENRFVLNWLRRTLRDFHCERSSETVTVYGSLAAHAGR
jgi:ribosomal protein S18 acetylase RimI-like enzyme